MNNSTPSTSASTLSSLNLKNNNSSSNIYECDDGSKTKYSAAIDMEMDFSKDDNYKIMNNRFCDSNDIGTSSSLTSSLTSLTKDLDSSFISSTDEIEDNFFIKGPWTMEVLILYYSICITYFTILGGFETCQFGKTIWTQTLDIYCSLA